MANEIKMVTINIPKGRTAADRDDVYVAVNGRGFLIQRGKSVKVPYYVAEVIEKSNALLDESYAYQEEAQKNANF